MLYQAEPGCQRGPCEALAVPSARSRACVPGDLVGARLSGGRVYESAL